MKILLAGASGLLGSALESSLARGGHEVVKLHRGATSTGPSWDPPAGRISLGAGAFNVVISLAGENIAQRWTPAAKVRIRESRGKATRLLSEALNRLPQVPRVFICASATGYYGDRESEILTEASPAGIGFLAEVCREWEAAAQSAAESGIRVVNLRLGIVLSPEGGALGKMLPAFRLGLGGRLGSGQQYWSWIALSDVVHVIDHVIRDETIRGPLNVVSPYPVTNTEFTKALGAVLGRPTFLSIPAFALKLLMGEMAEGALLASCRAEPTRLLQAGFAFQHPELKGAFQDLLARL
jgi:uncharacterized protein (TIGR01777 family)